MSLEIPEVKQYFFILIFLAVMLEVGADILFKKWSMGNKEVLFYLGLALYTGGTLLWALSLRYELLAKAITMFTVLNLLLVVLAGVFMFKETLSPVNKAGILLSVISIILLEV